MKDRAKEEAITGEPYDYRKDFTLLTLAEKRTVLKTAKNFVELLRDNALLDNAPASSMEAEK